MRRILEEQLSNRFPDGSGPFKKVLNIFFIFMMVALPTIVMSSCSDEILNKDEVSNNEKPHGPGKEFYIAVRIFDTAEASATRAAFDSDYDDNINSDYVFNKGLAAERALCRIEQDDLDSDGFLTKKHFLLFFDENGDKLQHSNFFIKEADDPAADDNGYGRWNFDIKEENGLTDADKNYYTAFASVYMSFDGEMDINGNGEYDYPDKIFDNGKILIVLNASDALSSAINNATTYDAVKKLIVKNDPDDTDADADVNDFLYRKEGATTYFTMTSSMVVKNGEVVPANLQGDAGRLTWYESEDKAKENPYAMYVERLQSKYTTVFKFKNENNFKYFGTGTAEGEQSHIVYTSGADFTPKEGNETLSYVKAYTRSESIENRKALDIGEGNWKVNFTGWGVNGLEKEENLFKKLTASENYYNNWNNPQFSAYRNFWAEDNNYNNTQGGYPDQYRHPEDATGVNGYDDISTLALNYLPYSSLVKRDTHQYSPENTLNTSVFGDDLKAAYDSQAYLRAGSHVIVGAQMLIEGFEPDGVYKATYADTDFEDGHIKSVDDKYRMNEIYWAKDAYLDYVVEYLGYWMLSSTNKELYGSIDGNFYVKEENTDNYRLADNNDFHPEKANIVGGDGWVWVKPNKGVTLYIKTSDETDPYKVLPLEEEEGNSTDACYKKLAFEHKEYMAAHFEGGRMYYAIPVKHNLRTSTDTPTIATGDYGAVRNHWYEFEVSNILSPGTSVDDEDQPIVPNNEPESIGLGVNISILDWHLIKIDDVDVSEQPRPNQ